MAWFSVLIKIGALSTTLEDANQSLNISSVRPATRHLIRGRVVDSEKPSGFAQLDRCQHSYDRLDYVLRLNLIHVRHPEKGGLSAVRDIMVSALSKAIGRTFAMCRSCVAFNVQLHQPLGRKADHPAQ